MAEFQDAEFEGVVNITVRRLKGLKAVRIEAQAHCVKHSLVLPDVDALRLARSIFSCIPTATLARIAAAEMKKK